MTESPRTKSLRTESLSDVEIELRFLRWFYQNCDFGPAHDDVIMYMMENYHAADPTNIIPPNYIEGYIGEDDSIR